MLVDDWMVEDLWEIGLPSKCLIRVEIDLGHHRDEEVETEIWDEGGVEVLIAVVLDE